MPGLRNYYDIVITVHPIVSYDVVSPLRVKQLAPDLLPKLREAAKRFVPYSAMFESNPRFDGEISRLAIKQGWNRKGILGYLGCVDFHNDSYISIMPDSSALKILAEWNLKPYGYITLHSGVDNNNNVVSGTLTTKQWPNEYYEQLIAKFKQDYPHIPIVQLGGNYSPDFAGIDINLVKKTNFNEVAWLLKYSLGHIDGESGLVRLARELATKSVVIFGPTSAEYFKFAENENVVPRQCGDCFWSTETWLTECPKGLERPICTDSISVNAVYVALKKIILNPRHFSIAAQDMDFYEKNKLTNNQKELEKLFTIAELQPVSIDAHAYNNENGSYLHIFFILFSHKKPAHDAELLIAIHPSGGIGDLVNISAFLTAFAENWPMTKFDIYFHSATSAKFIFAKAPFVRYVYSNALLKAQHANYDMVFTMMDWLRIDINKQAHHSLIPTLLNLFECAKQRFPHYDLYVEKHPLLDGHYARAMVAKGYRRISALGYFFDLNIVKNHIKIYPDLPGNTYLSGLNLYPQHYITVHDGFDNDYLNKARVSTKQWSLSHWATLCQLLTQAFPALKIVQLGAKTSRPIPGVSHSLVNQTTLEEATAILAEAKLHIDGESGLVRIASALGTKCITLFGPTHFQYFSIEGNVNIPPQACGSCSWLTDDWMATCPRQLVHPECLDSISPNQVFLAIKNFLT